MDPGLREFEPYRFGRISLPTKEKAVRLSLGIPGDSRDSRDINRFPRLTASTWDSRDSHRFRESRKAIDTPAPRGDHTPMIGVAACRDVAGARGGRWGRRSSSRGWSGSWGVRSRRGGRGASRPEEGNKLCVTGNRTPETEHRKPRRRRSSAEIGLCPGNPGLVSLCADAQRGGSASGSGCGRPRSIAHSFAYRTNTLNAASPHRTSPAVLVYRLPASAGGGVCRYNT